ncbi:MAG: response regulator transcription factor [Candidatus Caldatribacterium sp.]|uniref:response regulator n=1 Tax=Candidatus Caldatribacterium sp. TaxID=2282143 RepID=UPI00299904C8|nr:response regulator transcription factor [Candidatus Caldatribacterium sp.]MCX7730242.1 response regulator transcription factor [Candidatus Caldatribacterium sp.]MDW8080573.1 response regulator transcription factor [Candidatus Calescibacterium sp.]
METATKRCVVRVFLVDDNHFLLEGLTFLLKRQGDFEVVGVSPRGKGLFRRLTKVRPDVVLLDVCLGDSDGIAVLQRIRGELGIPVVMMSVYEEYREQAIKSGAFAYVLKGGDPQELYHILREAARKK